MIDINESVDLNRPLIARGLTGCDKVATYHGIGKSMALKVLRSETLSLSKVGEITLSVEDILV